MYYYLLVWFAASITLTAIAMYRKALLQNEVCLASLGDPEIDRRSYETALARRLSQIDRWTMSVFTSSLALVTGRIGFSVAIRFVHTPAVWNALRTAIRG